MATVLVIGATGLLGSSLVAKLGGAGHAVSALVRPGSDVRRLGAVELRRGDLLDRPSLVEAMRGCRSVFLAAGRPGHPPSREEWETHVLGAENACAAALEAGVERLVFTSSVLALEESGEPFGYAAAKREAEARVRAAGISAVIVQPGFLFGSGSSWFESAKAGTFRSYPMGGACWSWVEDVAQGHLLALEKGRPGEAYILGGHNLSYRDFLRAVCAASGVRPPHIPNPAWLQRIQAGVLWLLGRGGEIHPESIRMGALQHFFSSRKAEEELGYHITPLQEALRKSLGAAA